MPSYLTVFASLQGKYDEAASLYRRALTIDEKGLGPEHPNVAKDLDKTAGLLANQVMTVSYHARPRPRRLCVPIDVNIRHHNSGRVVGCDNAGREHCLSRLLVLVVFVARL